MTCKHALCRVFVLLLPLAMLAACGLQRPEAEAPVRVPGSERRLTLDALADRLARADFVLLGEVHDSAEAHRLQARLLQGLLARGLRPTLVMEQLGRDQRPEDAAARRRAMRQGGWPVAGYEPLLRVAEQAGLEIVGGNLTGRQLRQGDAVPQKVRALAAAHPLSPPARARLARDIGRAHCGMADAQTVQTLVRLQALRDATLAETMLSVPRPVVLVAGNGHTRRDYGVPRLLQGQGRVLGVGLVEREPGHDRLSEAQAVRAGAWDFVIPIAPVHDTDPCVRFRKQLQRLRHGD